MLNLTLREDVVEEMGNGDGRRGGLARGAGARGASAAAAASRLLLLFLLLLGRGGWGAVGGGRGGFITGGVVVVVAIAGVTGGGGHVELGELGGDDVLIRGRHGYQRVVEGSRAMRRGCGVLDVRRTGRAVGGDEQP